MSDIILSSFLCPLVLMAAITVSTEPAQGCLLVSIHGMTQPASSASYLTFHHTHADMIRHPCFLHGPFQPFTLSLASFACRPL